MMRALLSVAAISWLMACSAPPTTAISQPTPAPPTRTLTPAPTPTHAPAPTATPTPLPTPYIGDAYVNADLGLNLRRAPSLEAELIETLPHATHLTAFDRPTAPDADGIAWQNVHTDAGQAGWVAAEYLRDTPPPPPVTLSDLFTPYAIESLRARSYNTGPVEIVDTLQETAAFTRYAIAYRSDDLRVTAMLNVPKGDGTPDQRFPIIILNHGYVDPGRFPTGSYIRAEADALARRGYLTLSPDYRGYSGGEGDIEAAGPGVRGENSFRVDYTVDVLNLLRAVPSIPQADPARIGMWGHSMGGGITLKVLTVDQGARVKAAVLYGAMSGDEVANLRHIDQMWRRGIYDQVTSTFGTPEDWPDDYARISPLTYAADIAAPVSIHHGALDDQVPPAWSTDLAGRLQALNKPVELFEYNGAGHSLRDADWTTFMQRAAAFFDQYVKHTGG